MHVLTWWLQDLGLDPIVSNLELDRANPHLRQLAQATQGGTAVEYLPSFLFSSFQLIRVSGFTIA